MQFDFVLDYKSKLSPDTHIDDLDASNQDAENTRTNPYKRLNTRGVPRHTSPTSITFLAFHISKK
jgi:hypothetical protein